MAHRGAGGRGAFFHRLFDGLFDRQFGATADHFHQVVDVDRLDQMAVDIDHLMEVIGSCTELPVK